jgi:hypothetical protein
MQRRDVAVADEDFRVGADAPVIEPREQSPRAVAAADANDGFDLAVGEHLHQVAGAVAVAAGQEAPAVADLRGQFGFKAEALERPVQVRIPHAVRSYNPDWDDAGIGHRVFALSEVIEVALVVRIDGVTLAVQLNIVAVARKLAVLSWHLLTKDEDYRWAPGLRTAEKLRRLMNLVQFIQSHALSFFHLSAPDFLLGWETPRPQRNLFGLIASNAELARAGIRWTLVDDSHFLRVGMADSDLDGYFITEEESLPLKVYPGSQLLRYAIPWKTVEDVIEYLRDQASEEPGRIIVLGDDGEKFGSWPTTYAHCWEKGWMEDFLAALEENTSWLKTIPLGEHAERIQELVMKRLGICAAEISTQIVQRDRYAELVCDFAMIASSLDNFATEIRELSRPEIGEVFESFEAEKQVGSSTMPHKRNPETCERVCGLARIVRSLTIPALEDIITWHERDLTQSSAERFLLPEACILTDYILALMNSIVANLRVDEQRMVQNVGLTQGRCMSESVMMALARKGVNRQEAHEHLRKLTIISEADKKPFREVLLADLLVHKTLTCEEIDAALVPKNYLGTAIKQAEAFAKS